MTKASKILDVSYTYFKTYACETFNKNERKKALDNPEVPFITENNFNENAVYKEFKGYKK